MTDSGPGGDLPVRPWHLPGIGRGGPDDRGPWHRARTGAGAEFRVPALDAAAAGELCGAVRQAALRARRELDTEQVIAAVSASARRLADADSRWGEAAGSVLSAELGWSPRTARETLARTAETWTAESLGGLVQEELGGTGVLDGFRSAPGAAAEPRLRRASGPPLLCQVEAGNVPGVGVTGVIRALLVRSGVVARPSREAPGLSALFARSLADEAPELGRTVAVIWWPRTAEDVWYAVTKRCGKAIVYGGSSAVEALRRRVPPRTELVTYGPKLGLAVFLSDADVVAGARALARDVCAYEQRGCVSPRILFVPEGRRESAARAVDEALGEYVKDNDVPAPGAAVAAALRDLRARVEFGDDGDGLRLVGDPGELRWSVLTGPEPRVRSEALPRVIRVFAASGPDEVASRLRSLGSRVQALGYAGEEGLERLAAAAAEAGVSRLAPMGRLAWPPADWRHDGRHQLLPLLRWCDWELPGARGPEAGRCR